MQSTQNSWNPYLKDGTREYAYQFDTDSIDANRWDLVICQIYEYMRRKISK